jgi:hypothetical protein
MEKDGGKNGIFLPPDDKQAKKAGAPKTVHRDNHPKYTANMKKKIQKIGKLRGTRSTHRATRSTGRSACGWCGACRSSRLLAARAARCAQRVVPVATSDLPMVVVRLGADAKEDEKAKANEHGATLWP